jgi:hypothetical protein
MLGPHDRILLDLGPDFVGSTVEENPQSTTWLPHLPDEESESLLVNEGIVPRHICGGGNTMRNGRVSESDSVAWIFCESGLYGCVCLFIREKVLDAGVDLAVT